MRFFYLSLLLIHVCCKRALSAIESDVDREIIDINLPRNHLSQYFNNLPRFTKQLNETGSAFYKEFLGSEEYDREICWGYEYECKKPYHVHRCDGNHSGYVSSKQAQFDVFHSQADFGYIQDQRKQMHLFCEPYRFDDSSLECSQYLRFCRGRNLMINFTDLALRKEPFRWDNDVLKRGDIGGFCTLNEKRLEEELSHMSALQSWAPELRNFVSLDKRPLASDMCDVTIEKPTFVMKIDSTYNMYHHFCDFFNLYASLHLNFTHPSSFSTDNHIIIWETHDYWSPFAQVFSAFTENHLWTLNHFKGQRVCFKNIVFPLLPRMIYGLFYNTPLINGCENSALFHAFSEHILHRLQIASDPPAAAGRKIRITYLSRKTRYRNVLNERELIKRISKNSDYAVRAVVYDKEIKFIDQLKITHNTDVFIGMHGAGLTHLLFLPRWATLFELHNCGDPNCYKDLARLRGINYITWEDETMVESFEAGYTEAGHEKFRNYKFDADEFGRLVAKAAKSVKNNPEYRDYIERSTTSRRNEL